MRFGKPKYACFFVKLDTAVDDVGVAPNVTQVTLCVVVEISGDAKPNVLATVASHAVEQNTCNLSSLADSSTVTNEKSGALAIGEHVLMPLTHCLCADSLRKVQIQAAGERACPVQRGQLAGHPVWDTLPWAEIMPQGKTPRRFDRGAAFLQRGATTYTCTG
eukprot:m.435830 g.435830  ORF g.435830 m.435830 type:complete len:162 (+) comp20261_c1_seq13:3089-3574(+)